MISICGHVICASNNKYITGQQNEQMFRADISFYKSEEYSTKFLLQFKSTLFWKQLLGTASMRVAICISPWPLKWIITMICGWPFGNKVDVM